eukprot:10599992-Heterocapsa_arctica.AAC.1
MAGPRLPPAGPRLRQSGPMVRSFPAGRSNGLPSAAGRSNGQKSGPRTLKTLKGVVQEGAALKH